MSLYNLPLAAHAFIRPTCPPPKKKEVYFCSAQARANFQNCPSGLLEEARNLKKRSQPSDAYFPQYSFSGKKREKRECIGCKITANLTKAPDIAAWLVVGIAAGRQSLRYCHYWTWTYFFSFDFSRAKNWGKEKCMDWSWKNTTKKGKGGKYLFFLFTFPRAYIQQFHTRKFFFVQIQTGPLALNVSILNIRMVAQ